MTYLHSLQSKINVVILLPDHLQKGNPLVLILFLVSKILFIVGYTTEYTFLLEVNSFVPIYHMCVFLSNVYLQFNVKHLLLSFECGGHLALMMKMSCYKNKTKGNPKQDFFFDIKT